MSTELPQLKNVKILVENHLGSEVGVQLVVRNGALVIILKPGRTPAGLILPKTDLRGQ